MNRSKYSKYFSDLLYIIEQGEGDADEEAADEEEAAGGDEGLGDEGLGGEEEEPVELDKIFGLKKLYIKLISISKILDNYSHPEFNDIKDNVIEAIDVFHVIINNYEKLQDKMDDIIKNYRNFIRKCVDSIEYTIKKIEKEKNQERVGR